MESGRGALSRFENTGLSPPPSLLPMLFATTFIAQPQTCVLHHAVSCRMHNLSRELQRSNRINVRMMIVNGVPHGRGVFENIVDFDVFYDNRDLYIWNQVFGGAKDDIFVFNRLVTTNQYVTVNDNELMIMN